MCGAVRDRTLRSSDGDEGRGSKREVGKQVGWVRQKQTPTTTAQRGRDDVATKALLQRMI